MPAKAKKRAAAKPKKKAAKRAKKKVAKKARKVAKKAKKGAAKTKRKVAKKAKRKVAKKAKKVAKRKAPKKAAAKKAAAPARRVIVQFTRNRRNIGRPQLAPRGADDIHFVWRNPPGVFVRAWWTRGGRRIRRIPVPRYANDVHVRIR